MKNSVFVILAATIGLLGCSTDSSGTGGVKGKVDCYTIKAVEGGNTVFNATYSNEYSYVYEYKDSGGNKLYLSSRIQYQKYEESGYIYADSIIRAYPNRYSNDYVEYTFSRFVGFLTMEKNYYLDLGARTIDYELKWSEYKYENDPISLPEGMTSNNREAYSCAKTCYYSIINYPTEYFTLRLDLTESSLERHTYTILGEDSVITYTAKWF